MHIIRSLNYQQSHKFLRLTFSDLHFVMCLFLLAASYYLYFYLQLYKAIYIGWFAASFLTATFALAKKNNLSGLLKNFLPILSFYGWLLLSALWSAYPDLTLNAVAIDLLMWMVFFVAYSWALNNNVWRLSYYFEFWQVVLLVIAGYMFISTGFYEGENYGSLRTLLGGGLSIGLPFVFWRFLVRKTFWKLVILTFSILVSITLQSRSALLILPVAFFGTLWAVKSKSTILGKIKLSFRYALIAVMFFSFFLLFSPGMNEKFLDGINRFSSELLSLDFSSEVVSELQAPKEWRVDTHRRLQWFVASELFTQNPLLGGGYMSTLGAIREYFNLDLGAHGLPSTLLGESGLVGTALFLWMLTRFFLNVRRAAKNSKNSFNRSYYWVCIVSMICALMFGMGHSLQNTVQFYILLAWGYALKETKK